MRSPILLLSLSFVAGAWAQVPKATPAQKGDGPLTRASFTAKGLNEEEDLTDLFTGNFGGLSFDRGSLVLSTLFGSYLEAYSRHCGAYLPPNKVEMTAQVCNEAPAPPVPFGQTPPPSRPCMSFSTVSLGFADPALYAAKTQLDLEQAANVIKDLPSTLNNLKGSLHDLTRAAKDGFNFSVDMDALVRLNACRSPGLLRFQDNLALLSKGKPPLLLPGSPPVAPSVLPGSALADSDFNRLVEDLVTDEAKAWTFNRYVPGSTS